MKRSIAQYLIVGLTLATTLLLGAGYLLSYMDILHETEEVYDAELAQAARVLESLFISQDEDDTALNIHLPEQVATQPTERSDLGHRYEKKLAFQIWDNSGRPLLGNSSDSAPLSWAAKVGYGYEHEQRWRTFTLHSDSGLWIKVGQDMEIREEIAEEINKHNIQPLLLIVPLLWLMIWLIVRRGLRPLRQVSSELYKRNAEYLDPIDISSAPNEIAGVVYSINRLMKALERSLQQQKRFTSNAAHELRTPLAAIRIQAQNLLLTDTENLVSQQQIINGVDRLSHMVNQLLTLSRLESGERRDNFELIDIHAGIHGLLQDQRRMIRNRKLDVSLLPAEPVHARVTPDCIDILLRNLLDNALRYTPDGGRVQIEIDRQKADLRVRISDTGPGLDAEQKKRVFDRFYRAAGQGSDGCGIGLSIVQEICERTGYRVSLSDSQLGPHGLCAELTCPGAMVAAKASPDA
ncbi:two-component sensor histidine kinase [Marinobacterium zhoushanense]|uniref:histidine kinase n=1 Tax=Marinobacterium zhoushanense TaxID=1679163 RepID=A0ABQ1K1S7_9GAMM|nr:ATP-binding protein [Marinobacterium zhoushanense]GGB81128.1 two-component sensor histidine kinase [Marinobacterium zhoushanense]